MNWIQGTVHRLSFDPPPSENHASYEKSTHSSSSASGTQGGSSPVGLGISYCELENDFSQLRVLHSTPTLPSQLIPEAPSPTFAFYNDCSVGPCYPAIYNGLPDSLADVSLGLYGPTTMSATPSYNSSMELDPSQVPLSSQMDNIWIPTPCSVPITPPDLGLTPAMNGTAEQWGQSMFADASILSMSQLPSNDISYVEAMEREVGYDSPPGQQNIDTEQAVPQPQDTTEEQAIDKTKKSSRKKRSSSADKLVSASGLECPICGAEFTRRSNCKEHQKLHNPKWKNSHVCDHCFKPFRRSSDLKRHRDSVHYGVRRYSCKWCSHRFTRRDTLTSYEDTIVPRNAGNLKSHLERSRLVYKPRRRI